MPNKSVPDYQVTKNYFQGKTTVLLQTLKYSLKFFSRLWLLQNSNFFVMKMNLDDKLVDNKLSVVNMLKPMKCIVCTQGIATLVTQFVLMISENILLKIYSSLK